LPIIKRDPDYLVRKKIRVLSDWKTKTIIDLDTINWSTLNTNNFTYRLQQAPGKQNALGQIKFMISNERAIYLHDTSQKQLFAKTKRTLSSGCIRVEKPLELATALLNTKSSWNKEDLTAVIAAEEPRKINLDTPIPVYLTYWTAWVNQKGVLQLRDDIYRNDEKQLTSLATNPPSDLNLINKGKDKTI